MLRIDAKVLAAAIALLLWLLSRRASGDQAADPAGLVNKVDVSQLKAGFGPAQISGGILQVGQTSVPMGAHLVPKAPGSTVFVRVAWAGTTRNAAGAGITWFYRLGIALWDAGQNMPVGIPHIGPSSIGEFEVTKDSGEIPLVVPLTLTPGTFLTVKVSLQALESNANGMPTAVWSDVATAEHINAIQVAGAAIPSGVVNIVSVSQVGLLNPSALQGGGYRMGLSSRGGQAALMGTHLVSKPAGGAMHLSLNWTPSTTRSGVPINWNYIFDFKVTQRATGLVTGAGGLGVTLDNVPSGVPQTTEADKANVVGGPGDYDVEMVLLGAGSDPAGNPVPNSWVELARLTHPSAMRVA